MTAAGSVPSAGPWRVRAVGCMLLLLPFVLAGAGLEPAFARSEARRGTPESKHSRKRRREAIRAGCEFIASKQNLGGSFGEGRATVAITALSVLALMSEGSTDHRGRYRKQIHRGLTFLIKLIEMKKPSRYPKGYFFHAQDQDSRMHGQGFATLALACALGTSDGSRTDRIRTALRLAIKCIEGAQALTGGFGYEPRPGTDHEGSVTVGVAQGLRAARDAGLIVNDRVVKKGLTYLRKSQKGDGSFQYSLHRPHSSYALTAAAMSSFFLYGHYEDKKGENRIKKGLEYLRERLDRSGAQHSWYYYGHFYAAWALWQWDGHTWARGPENQWGNWQAIVYPDLLSRQRGSDGSFEPFSGRFDYGPILTTAFAVLTLSIPDETLPVFQR